MTIHAIEKSQVSSVARWDCGLVARRQRRHGIRGFQEALTKPSDGASLYRWRVAVPLCDSGRRGQTMTVSGLKYREGQQSRFGCEAAVVAEFILSGESTHPLEHCSGRGCHTN